MSSSILFPAGPPTNFGAPSETTADLHLDDIVETITSPRAEYGLVPIFLTPLERAADVRFRQAVFRDVHRAVLRPAIDEFANGMRTVRRLLDGLQKLYSHRQKQAWFLDAADQYCRTVDGLDRSLQAAEVEGDGLQGVRERVASLTRSREYQLLHADTARVVERLHDIRYDVTVMSNRVLVAPYRGDGDYSEEVLNTFDRFRQRNRAEQPAPRRASTYMNHVDAAVLDLVARLQPAEFDALDAFCTEHTHFVDDDIDRFDREIQFYVAMSDFTERLSRAGLPLCFPTVSDDDLTIDARDVYDIALADKLVRERRPVVRNDLVLRDGERVIVVTGPNQGGKTTFARLFGQLHYLAALGCPVPGLSVQLGMFDRIFTHFERAEVLTNLSGKLEDELIRVRRILDAATPRSVIVMNESFGSTSLEDSRLLGTAIIERLIDLDVRMVYVTFVDELSRIGPSVVSMTSTVERGDPASRTFKIVRQPADGLAYAMSLAERHGLTARQLEERIVA